MTRVTCDICREANPLAKAIVIQSSVIGRNEQEDMVFLGQAMLAHLQGAHEAHLHGIAQTSKIINGLLVLRHFDSTDEAYMKEREIMRDQASEAIMLGSEETEDEDIEEYIDEQGITHSADCECEYCMEDAEDDDEDLDESLGEDEDDGEDEDGEEDETTG